MQGRQKRYSGQVALLLTPCLLLLGSHTQADIDVGLFGIAARGGTVTSSRFTLGDVLMIQRKAPGLINFQCRFGV